MTMLVSIFNMIYRNGIDSAKLLLFAFTNVRIGTLHVPYMNIEAELHNSK
jgi:hypothetical protein